MPRGKIPRGATFASAWKKASRVADHASGRSAISRMAMPPARATPVARTRTKRDSFSGR